MTESQLAFNAAVAEARITILEERLKVCMAEQELLTEERDAALLELDRLRETV